MLINIAGTTTDILENELLLQKKVTLSTLRLDEIHPVVSGNKLFKLHYFLEEAGAAAHRTLLTFGGTYSNHLVATAYACRQAGINSIGIVRGEAPANFSLTLQHCISYGMQLQFVPREVYDNKQTPAFLAGLQQQYGPCTIVPEGGYHPTGAAGAALIWELIPPHTYSHICTATGTAATLAGLLLGAGNETIISVPVLKGMTDIEARVAFCGAAHKINQLKILSAYHFGGYAKKTPELLDFMNTTWQQQQLPTDFVYTAKMLFAIMDQIKNNCFSPGSRILCLHTGGLQGNLSLPANTLLF